MAMNIVEKSWPAPAACRASARAISSSSRSTPPSCSTTISPRCYWRDVFKVADPDKIVVAFDHRVPPPDKASAQAQVVGREFVKRFGIKRFHDIGRDQGISHVVVADNGYALPGTVLVCSDTHTGSRRRVQLRGARRRRAGCHVCRDQGRDLVPGLSDHPLRHRGQARARRDREGCVPLSRQHPRRSRRPQHRVRRAGHDAVCGSTPAAPSPPMCTELNAEFAIFEADDAVIDYVRKRNPAPFTPTAPDADAG